MKKFYTIIAAALMVTAANAKTINLGSGKWTEVYNGAIVKADDVVVISGQVTMNTGIIVEGTLQVEKGASMVGMKDLVVAKTGKFINNGNTVVKRIVNEGTINNNLLMEAMVDVDNKGGINNNNNIVAGNNFTNYGGNVGGEGGAYFANNNVSNSSSTKVSQDVKVFYGNSMQIEGAAPASSMILNADIKDGSVILNVTNANKAEVTLFAIEKSTDGKNYTLLETINKVNSNSNVAMSYTDNNVSNNITYYRVKAVDANGQEITLPVASVKPSFADAFTMAK